MKILIVKTSSLGDIIQSFPVLNDLHVRFPGCLIDWVVEEHLASVVQAHPLVRKAIAVPIQRIKKKILSLDSWKALFRSLKLLRFENYQWVFDIQGNTKSGVITFFSRSDLKIGFGYSSVREWPNILATKVRFSVPKQLNIRAQYLSLIQQFFQDSKSSCEREFQGVQFIIDLSEEAKIRSSFDSLSRPLVMVCPSSKWINKQLKTETLTGFLSRIQQNFQAHFLLVWGSLEEKEYCKLIQKQCENCHVLNTLLEIPTWQYLMNQMDLVIAVDSSALHLCGTTKTPSFSIFGPTSAEVFKPPEKRHFSFQGQCPYGNVFLKQCPILRSCPTGACIRDIIAEDLYQAFSSWWHQKGIAKANPVFPADAL